MPSRSPSLTPLVLLAVVLAVAALPPATASDAPALTIDAAPFPEPLRPLSGLASTDVTVSVDCDVFAGGENATRARVDLEAEAPEWATVTLAPVTIPVRAPCPEGERFTETARVIATTTARAPAFTPANVTVMARLNGGNGTIAETAGNVPVEAGYFSILEEETPEPQRTVPAGQAAAFDVTVRNLGNGDTRVTFRVDEQPDGWNVVPPAPRVLGAEQTGADEIEGSFRLMVMPGVDTEARVGTVHVTILGEYAHAPAEDVENAPLTVLVTVEGGGILGKATPGPGIAVTVLALALVAARRERL